MNIAAHLIKTLDCGQKRPYRLISPVYAVLLISFLAATLGANARAIRTDTLTLNVLYPQSKAVLDTAYMGNGEKMRIFEERMLDITSAPDCHIRSITVKGYASPEGTMKFNADISRARAINISEYVSSLTGIPTEDIRIEVGNIDWDGLEREVARSSMKSRERVLDIIINVPELVFDKSGKLVDSRKKRLMDLDHGNAWRWMSEHIFPYLRTGRASIECNIELLPQPETPVEVPDTLPEVEVVDTVEEVVVVPPWPRIPSARSIR